MFQTDVASEVQIPVALNLDGEKSWWYVKKRLHMCWFHVICEMTYADGCTSHEIFFLDQIDHLSDLNNNAQYRIVEVELVSPAHMNGSDYWNMEPLLEIQEGIVRKADSQYHVHTYILKDGRRYIDSVMSETDKPEIKTTTSLFKFENS